MRLRLQAQRERDGLGAADGHAARSAARPEPVRLELEGGGSAEHQRLQQELAAAQARIQELTERERRLVEAQAVAHVGSWTWDAGTGEATWSAEMYRIFDRDPQQGPLNGAQFLEWVDPVDRRHLEGEQPAAYGGGTECAVTCRITTASGQERLLHICCRTVSEGRYAGTVQDMTQLRAAEHPLSHSERTALEQLQAAFDRSPLGMGVADATGRILRANDALSWITGYTNDELCQMTPMSLVHPDDVDQVRSECAPLQSGEEAVSYAHRVQHAAGHTIWVQVTLTVLRDDSGQTLHSLLQMVDVSEQRVYEDELHHMADHDPLTGLLNRRGFETALRAHLARCRRYGTSGALLMLDLDGFKAVNDTLGHAAGDELLKSTATALATRLRESDVVARLGGDEFAVLLPTQHRAEAEAVAAALLEMIRTRVTACPGGEAGLVNASIGIAPLDVGDVSAEELMANADAAMYASKAAGKGRFTVHASSAAAGPVASSR